MRDDDACLGCLRRLANQATHHNNTAHKTWLRGVLTNSHSIERAGGCLENDAGASSTRPQSLTNARRSKCS